MIVLTETALHRVVPDTILANLTVYSGNASYQRCREHLEQRAGLILQRLNDLPSTARIDIDAGEPVVRPRYDHEQQTIFKGFDARQDITARFANHPETMQMFYAAVVLMEDPPLVEVSSFLSDPAPARAAALQKAVSRCTETARAAAVAAGRELGELVYVYPEVEVKHAVVGESGGTLEAGELEVVAHVEMKFRFA